VEIEKLHFELSTFCNAACPLCLHDPQGIRHPLLHLTIPNLKKILKNNLFTKVNLIQLCGSHGDPMMHPKILEIIEEIKSIYPRAIIEISTNGSLRNADFWKKISLLLNSKDHIIFGIDGLQDTHHLYRKNTDFTTVITNAKTFINSGGNAWWQFIPFKHNQHQILDAFKLSQKYSFGKFFIKYERACYNEKLPGPTISPTINKELIMGRVDTDSVPSFINEMQFSKNCIHINQKSIYIKADGTVTPCCFMSKFNKCSLQYDQLNQKQINNNKKILEKSWKSSSTAFVECKKNCYSTH